MSFKGDYNQWQRRLSLKQAWNCEMALELRCRCRCRGAAHGKKRLSFGPGFRDDGEWAGGEDHRNLVASQLAKLPADDPHFIELQPSSQLGPMRKVVDRIRTAYGWRQKKFSVKLILECGHSVSRKGSRFTGKKKFLKSRLKRVHCPECASPNVRMIRLDKPGWEDRLVDHITPKAVAHKKKSPTLPANRWVRKTSSRRS